MTAPLVSCIMPTRQQRRFVSQAILYFLRQDYEPRELIVVDDGEDGIADLVPHDVRIRYVRLEQRLPLGAKRNLACSVSCGEIVAHWDDDDWIAPHRLSTQVASLLATGADVVGTRDLLHYHLEAGEAWLYRYPEDERPWLAGGTLLYRRPVWAEHPFPEVNVGEDTAFVWQAAGDRLHALPDLSLYVALIHAGNTGFKNLRDPRWHRRPLDEVTRLLEPDRPFYVALRHGRSPHVTARPAPPASVTLAAPFYVYDGYGSMAEYLALGLARAGATVNLVPLRLDPAGSTQELRTLLARSRPEPHAPALCFTWLFDNLQGFQASSDLFINTVWETSRLPAGWADILNQARAVIAPSDFAARVFRDSGVTRPIEVVPQGVDPKFYQYEERAERPGITTLMVGTVVPRKNMKAGIAAWKAAFAGDVNARLIIKARFGVQQYVPDDPRILFIDAEEPTRGIAHWYRQADVLLALGNEGFGLSLVEGMATGLPVIALNSEGQAEVCQAAAEHLLPVEPVRWQEFDQAPFGPCGVRGIPGVADIAAQLRWVAEHRDAARDMGRNASEWALRHRNVWTMGLAILDLMERYVQPARPLRRVRVLWQAETPAGERVSRYTGRLAAALPAARVSMRPPDLRSARLLHIQCGRNNLDNVILSSYIRQARSMAVPVVVTEHHVTAEARAFEGDADALVALTERDGDILRACWPAKRIEVLPDGGVKNWSRAVERQRSPDSTSS